MPGDAWPVQPRAWGLEHGGGLRPAPDRPVTLSASGDTGEDLLQVLTDLEVLPRLRV